MTKQEIKKWILENAITIDENGGKELDLSGVNMGDISINFKGANTWNVNFENAKTWGVNFKNSQTTSVNFDGAKISRVDFRNVKTRDVNFTSAKTWYIDFRNAETGGVDFRNAKTKFVDFENAKTFGVDFVNSKTRYVNFRNAKTEKVDFTNAKTGHVDFGNAETENVDFEGAETKHFFTPKEKALYKGKWYNYITLDGITSIIDEDKRKNGIGVFKDVDGRYIATNGRISYHSFKDYDDAKKGLKAKKEKMFANFKPFIKKCKKQGYITIDEFREITGACEAGTNAWLNRNKIEIKDEYDWDYAIKMFEKYPTMETNLILNVVKEMENENE